MTSSKDSASADADQAAAPQARSRRGRTRRDKLRRRLAGVLALGVALAGVGALYAVFAPEPQTAQAAADPALVRKGEQLYNNTCISCHGSNLEGVKDQGPSLIGIGEAAVYFQTSTGRMPMSRQEAQPDRSSAKLSPDQIDAVMAYVQSNGGGPELPKGKGKELRGDDTARGAQLFRLNCASCHNFTGQGGALSSGKYAPELKDANEQQIYAAMVSGPANMPKFSDRQLSKDEKEDIIAYVKSVSNGDDGGGGLALGGFGPASEGVVAWVVGIGVLLGATLWIGSRA